MSDNLFTHTPSSPRSPFLNQAAFRWNQLSSFAKKYPAETSAITSFVFGVVLSGTLVQGIACGAIAFLASKVSDFVRPYLPTTFPWNQISTVLLTCGIIRLFVVLPLSALGVHLHVHMLWTALSTLAFQMGTGFLSGGQANHHIFPLVL